MTSNRLIRPFPLTALTLAAFPLLLLIAFLGYVIEARLQLGHWPAYGQPDPKQLGWWLQHSLLQLGFVGFPVVALAAMGLTVLGRVRSRDFPWLTISAITVVGSTALIAFARVDPGGFMDWFWD